ncbi:MAG: D-alanyl-D-alanine carboxypeptidase/D-alanyl-D-alanine-endopeptidase [Paracoccaceae bacterium]
MKRRNFLGGLAATLPVAAFSETMTRPLPRAGRRIAPSQVGAILNEFGIGAVTSFMVVDLATGQVREAHQPDLALPPASVTKALTALYAQRYLGAGFRFETRVLATGALNGSTLQGDLVLQGSGDPLLDTDRLAALAAEVARAGIRRISGRFILVDNTLPHLQQIDASQPPQAGYNPGISGLNLNYNRVYFEWQRASNGYAVSMDARSDRFKPVVDMARMEVVNRQAPLYTYRQANGRELWTVARPALGDGGGRWLPVRDPANYAAQVFATLAAAHGIALPAPQSGGVPQGARAISETHSPMLTNILADMLRFSTNLTAEVLGLRASAAAGRASARLNQSAAAMGRWAQGVAGGAVGAYENHSGLSGDSRASAQNLVRVMTSNEARVGLRNILRETVLVDAQGNGAPVPGRQVFGKTGTLNFAHGISGFIERDGQQRLAYAIFAADMAARANAPSEEERPRGSRPWLGRARAQEQALLRRWASLYT